MSQTAPWLRFIEPQRAMDSSVYLDEEIFALEQRTVLATTWQFACHTSALARPGDYVTSVIAGESLFTIKDKNGSIHTFYNVCMHRGHELVEGSGSKRLVVCPYHAWSYRLDGELHKAPHAEGRAGFDADGICLTSVRTEDFLGFLFVNLDGRAPGMDIVFPGVRDRLRAFLPTIERMVPIERRDFLAESNWKIAVENYNECYHCRNVHSSFSRGVILGDTYTIKPIGHCLQHEAMGSPNQYYQIAEGQSPNAANYSSFYLWPLFSIQVYPGPVLNTFCWRPETVNRTPFSREWFSLDGIDSDTIHGVADEDARTTVAEDLDLVRSVQRGVASRGYRPGPLIVDPDMGVNSEHSIAVIKAWYQDAMP